jgi:pSer/pThr/pTyr-binding forkhead associated (FHA) protein
MAPGLLLEEWKHISGAPKMTQNLVALTQEMAHEPWHWQDKAAKLSLKFSDNVLQEVVLNGGVVTIGRQPDCLLRIDNPIVSGHHARIFWANNHYVLEDNESFNGTFLNNRNVSTAALSDGDIIVIGKHRIEFHSEVGKRDVSSSSATVSNDRSSGWQAQVEKTAPPQLDATMVLDTVKLKEMMAKMAAAAPVRPSGIALVPACESTAVRQRQIGRITILSGRTDRQQYVLSSKLSVIGKSMLASIRLKRWFAPRVAASIHQREEGYFLVRATKNIRIKVNHAELTQGQQELKSGDQFEVAGIIARFGYENG